MAKYLDDTGLGKLWAKIKATFQTLGNKVTSVRASSSASDDKYPSEKAVASAIEALDVSSVGGAGKYISAISESDGKISATETTMDTTPTASSTKAVTSGGVNAALNYKVTTYSLGTTASTENYTMFARMSSSNAQGNGEASFIVSAAGNIGTQGEGAWLVNISNRGSSPYMAVKTLRPVGKGGWQPQFGYYTDSTNGYFYFGLWTSTYRGKCDIIVLTNSGASCQDFGDTTAAPTGWTTVTPVNSYGVNNVGSFRTDAVNPAWGLLAEVNPPVSKNSDVCVQFHFSVTGAGTYLYDYGIAYVEIRYNSDGTYSATASFIRENLTNADKFTLKFYWDSTNHKVLIYGYATEATYRGINLSILKCTNYDGLAFDPENFVKLCRSFGSGSSAPSGYSEMTPKVGFIPRTTTNAAVGGAGVPVYVKAGGEIAACTESNFDRLVDVSSYTTYSSIVAVVTAGHTPYCTSGTKKFYYQYHESASAGSFVYFGALANGRYVYRTFSQDPGAAAGSFGNTETINLTTAKMPYFEETDPEWNNLTDTGEYNITSSANVGTKNSPEGGYMSLRSVHSTNGTTEYDSQLAFGDNLYYRVKPNGGNWSNWDWIVRSKTGVCFIDTSGAIGSDLNTIYIV